MLLRLPLQRLAPQPASNKKVYVGLSGGVDSAVSAALLQKQGYDVTGIFIKIQIPGYPCLAARDRVEAMRVAAHLDIPFLEVDLSKEYTKEVFTPSIEEFKKGNTPNPDTLCNEKIKFGIFFDFCMSRGAEYVATGHYARLASADSPSQKSSGRLRHQSAPVGFQTFAQENRPALYMSVDANKDQSYFLWAVPETTLRHTLFPIGNLQKSQVRALAKKFGLPNAARPDSQGLCFLGDITIENMLEREVPHQPGNVLSERGEIIGTHQGAELYTLGQRHGFSLSHDVPHKDAQYVIAKDMRKNTITVSPSRFPRNVRQTAVNIGRTNWIGPSFAKASEGEEVMARYRYRQTLIPAVRRTVLGKDGGPSSVEVTLQEPHYVPLGQSLVLYQGERCLGGGVIMSATLTP